jgi:hypothetical protein
MMPLLSRCLLTLRSVMLISLCYRGLAHASEGLAVGTPALRFIHPNVNTAHAKPMMSIALSADFPPRDEINKRPYNGIQ